MSLDPQRNLVLIGMPSAGKSTVGGLVAQTSGRPFIDTDRLVEGSCGMPLPAFIRERGVDAFRALEQECVQNLDVRGAVIATGGSVVYSEAAMKHLASSGLIVFLDAPLTELEQRLRDLSARAVVARAGQSVAELYAERRPLYQRWAEITLPCTAASIREVAAGLASRL